ncbi:hypothetical protein C0995_006341 [Termitomyces sp. Mi166|nr:hypothetical protein C0995_006341 [Termitomyces sp. Mi166\
MLIRYLRILSAITLPFLILYPFAPCIVRYRDENRCLRALVSFNSRSQAIPSDSQCEVVGLFQEYQASLEHISISLANAQEDLEALPTDACLWLDLANTANIGERNCDLGAYNDRAQEYMESVKTRRKELEMTIKALQNQGDSIIQAAREQVESNWRLAAVVDATYFLVTLLLVAALYIWRTFFPINQAPIQLPHVRPLSSHVQDIQPPQPPQHRVYIKVEDD